MEGSNQSFSHKALDPITLKESTKQLLNLVDELQSRKLPENFPRTKPCDTSFLNNFDCDEDYDDNCTIYDRLTGKCRCVNRTAYNDIMIYFNEEYPTKHKSSTMGNIVRNVKILKRILYLGGKYTMYTLSFLNEGITMSTHVEKIKIADACAYADICNLFEDHSIVKHCLPWKTSNYNNNNDQEYVLQALAANFIHHLALLENGKYYLTLSSRMFDELSRTVRKSGMKMEPGTVEVLRKTQNYLLMPPGMEGSKIFKISDMLNTKYGMGNKLLKRLKTCHRNMTQSEIMSHLEILRNLSYSELNKRELREDLDNLLEIFRELICYDESGINVIITIIMDNILPQSENTEPVKMSECKDCQVDIPYKQKISISLATSKIRKLQNSGKSAAIIVPIETNSRHK